MASNMRTRAESSVDPASVQAILTPIEPLSPTPAPLVVAQIVSSFTPRNPNRLSLNFPIATGTTSTDSPRPTPTSSNSYSFPPTPIEAPPSPNDPGALLVAMAAQERRVLEIKEELQKAERELGKLKSQWQSHERKKKRAESRQLEQLQPLPLQAVVMDDGRSSEDTPSKRQSMEIERRKSLILKTPRESRRKQFSGSHTRALSLLSPERSNFTRPFPPVGESSSNPVGLPTPRSTPVLQPAQGTSNGFNRSRHSYQSNGVTHGAKQIAQDLKTGMWTFLEDLRQATIGDEGAGPNTNRVGLDLAHNGPKKKGSKGSLRMHKNRHSYSPGGTPLPRTWDSLTGSNLGLGFGDVEWSGTPTRSPSKSPSPVKTVKKKPSRHLSFAPVSVNDLDDDWSNWDSPAPKSPSLRWSGSTDLSGPLTPDRGTSDDTPVKIASEDNSTPTKREDLQWPALETFTPTNLKKTVSSLMQEWEKTLTPPMSRAESPTHDSGAEQEHSIAQMPLM